MKRIISVLLAIGILSSSSAFATFVSSASWTAQGKVEVFQHHINPATDNFYFVLLLKSAATGYTTSIGSYSSTGELATSGGYTQGGQLLTGCAVTLVAGNASFTCNTPSWTNTSVLTFDGVAIYDATCTGCANANQVLYISPTTSSFSSSSSGTFTVPIPAGVLGF